MQATRVVCPEAGRFELETVDLPPPGQGQVLLRTEYTAVSPGTERAWSLHEPNTPVRFPYHPGYCHVGRVIEVGPGVRELAPGDRVLSRASHASAAVIRAEHLQPVPDGLAPEAAVMAPLGEIALQGVRRAKIEVGSAVCVIGAGVIGGLAMKFARLAGAHPLVAADISAWRRERTSRCGATEAVAPSELPALAGRVQNRRTPDAGFDAVIDATGNPLALNTAISVAASGATILLLGSTRGAADGVNVYDIHAKGLEIVGAHGRNTPPDQSRWTQWTRRDNEALVLRLLKDGVLTIGDLVTDTVRPAEVLTVFERLRARDETLLGCVVDWR